MPVLVRTKYVHHIEIMNSDKFMKRWALKKDTENAFPPKEDLEAFCVLVKYRTTMQNLEKDTNKIFPLTQH